CRSVIIRGSSVVAFHEKWLALDPRHKMSRQQTPIPLLLARVLCTVRCGQAILSGRLYIVPSPSCTLWLPARCITSDVESSYCGYGRLPNFLDRMLEYFAWNMSCRQLQLLWHSQSESPFGSSLIASDSGLNLTQAKRWLQTSQT